MVFAMGIGAVYYLNTQPSNPNQLLVQEVATGKATQSNADANLSIANQNEEVSASGLSDIKNDISDDSQLGSKGSVVPGETTLNSDLKSSGTSQKTAVTTYSNSVATNGDRVIGSKTDDSTDKFNHGSLFLAADNSEAITYRKPSTKLLEFNQPKIVIPVSEVADPGMVLLARLEDEERRLNANEKPRVNEKTWTSFGVGAGSFDPQSKAVSQPTAPKTSGPTIASPSLAPKSTPVISNPSAGTSYSVGMSFAGKLSRRVVLQGGLSYLSQNAEFTSSTSEGGDKATLNEVAALDDNSYSTSPYKVNSNLKYLSVPMQAGYIVLDRSFGVQLNGGISTDLFLQNTLTPSDKSLDKVSQGAGSDSPYRTVNFSGLVGTEFSYKVGDHYRIALNPGLRYALNSIYKSEIGTEISPMTFDVAVRFRYIFK
jgi:hypothetical protein